MSSVHVLADFVNWCIACAASGTTIPGGIAAAGGIAAVVTAWAAFGAKPPGTSGSADGKAEGDKHELMTSFDYGDREEEAAEGELEI